MILHDTARRCRFRGRSRLTSHLMSDLVGTVGTEELVSFAIRLGLLRDWIQNEGTETEHFDLFDGAILRARSLGSTPVASRELITRVVWPKRAARAAKAERAYRDPLDPGNALRPDVRCAGCGVMGCTTAWGPWCFACNVERMDRISKNLEAIAADLRARSGS